MVVALGWPLGSGLAGCNERPVDDDPVPAEVRAYAQQRCQRIEQCGCSNAPPGSPEECEARIVAIYQQAMDGREGIQLDCFAAGAELWRTADCDDPPADTPCNALTPHDGVGAACSINPFADAYVHADSCAEGLVCFDDRCVEPVVDGVAGEPCLPGGQCDPALTCIEGRCEPPRAEGEACDEAWDCEQPELYCAAKVCTMRTASGAECTSDEECAYTVPCVDGRCTPISPSLCVLGEV